MQDILVLGAGMVGVSTALALQGRGHKVVLADRRLPGEETSYGNAGVIQAEAAEPYAMPRDLPTLLRYVLGQSNDLVWSPAGIASMAPALWRYFRASSPARHRAVSAVYSQLTAQACAAHAPLIEASGSGNLIAREGLAILHRDPKAFETEAGEARRLQEAYGVPFRAVAGAAWMREEPSLRQAPAGVIHYTGSWSCSDPGGLTKAYAALFESRGGTIAAADAATLRRTSSGWQVAGAEGPAGAQTVVLCLGPWTGQLLKRFGIPVPMVLKRGYHAHYQAPQMPRRPFLDAANGIVVAGMRKGLRLSSGAALVTHGAKADPRQLRRAEASVGGLIELGPRIEEPQWSGTRPCLPGMLPMVGPVPRETGLWVNFGHGHQGFTLGPVTADILARALDGELKQDAPGTLPHALSPASQLS